MAEAEDVITDVARHATVFAQDLWRRRRSPKTGRQPLFLADVTARLDLLIVASFGRSFPIRSAQSPAPPSTLERLFRRQRVPRVRNGIAATDGTTVWLPSSIGESVPPPDAFARYRIQALRQALRAVRGSASVCPDQAPPLLRDLYLLFEAHACDVALMTVLPGTARPLAALRSESLSQRPAISALDASVHPIERLVRAVLTTTPGQSIDPEPFAALAVQAPTAMPQTPRQCLRLAQILCNTISDTNASRRSGPWIWRDQWTGELRAPRAWPGASNAPFADVERDQADDDTSRSARLVRRPEVRDAIEDEDDQHSGVWMVQTAVPNEAAEDPMGLSRPTDRDDETAADEFADALSELPEARLVSTPGRPKEYLLSDDADTLHGKRDAQSAQFATTDRLQYPEWDWRTKTYRHPGATVLPISAALGPQQWVDDALAKRASMLYEIRRRFELLRSERVRQHRQFDGDQIDLAAYVEARAAFRAGLSLDQRLYVNERPARRDLAVLLLVDVSGSTDSFISGSQRVIDVEREALLLVCLALEGLDAPYSVQAFSGEGPQAVTVRSVKAFSERYSNEVGQRIAGLEPENYTRAGAAVRHATALLMREPAERRLLLLLSDGKPNDIDEYDGRMGVEDMRQSVMEARLQGVSPFCLTVDRMAANYLGFVFGPHQYALMQRPELLPGVLLDWLRRLIA